MKILRLLLFSIILIADTINAESQYLRRTLGSIREATTEFSTSSAHYFPVFGTGSDSSEIIKGLTRYGNLSIDPSGESKYVNYQDEELVICVLEGTGILNWTKDKVPISVNDFIYIPAGMKFSLSNPRERELSVIVMSFTIMPGNSIKPSAKLMIANADEVPFQVLGSHGPTTTFQLLMGTTESTRDRLAAACQVTSLFIMDFDAKGTNIPHRHDDEEEIYLVLRGKGEIVAGETPDGKELRHPSAKGDAFFFAPKTLIGFYSGNTEGEEHARILAVRFKYPSR